MRNLRKLIKCSKNLDYSLVTSKNLSKTPPCCWGLWPDNLR